MGVWSPLLACPSLNNAQERGFNRSVVSLHDTGLSQRTIDADELNDSRLHSYSSQIIYFYEVFKTSLGGEHRYRSDFIFSKLAGLFLRDFLSPWLLLLGFTVKLAQLVDHAG